MHLMTLFIARLIGEDQLQLACVVNGNITALVLIAKGMARNDDGFLP